LFCLLGLQTITLAQTGEQSMTLAQTAKQPSPWSIGFIANVKARNNLFVYDFGITLTKSIAQGHRLGIEVEYRTAVPIFEQPWGRALMKMESNVSSGIGGVNYQWFPFVASSREVKSRLLKSLKLKTGFWYVGNPVYEFKADLVNPITWGSTTFTADEMGSVFTTITTQNFQPYLGLGYDRFYVGKRTNIVLEGGMFYQGKAQVTMLATNIISQTSEKGIVLQNNLEYYQLIPFLQLQLQIRL